MAKGEHGAARRELERCLVVDPACAPARQDLAVIALSAGKAERALELLAGLEDEAGAPRTLFYRALALGELGREEDARGLMRELAAAPCGKYALKAASWLAERDL